MLFDILFMLIIAIAVPVIVCIGVKLSVRKPSYKNLAIAFTVALLAAEVVRFFCNASLYDGAITPKADLKFNFMTVLTILCLFATFNQKFSQGLRSAFVLLLLVPVVFAIMRPECYINALDEVNGVGKALYYLQIGFSCTVGLVYMAEQNWKLRAVNLLWAGLAVLLYAGIDALTIWYWEWNVPFDAMWYLTYVIALLSAAIVWVVFFQLRKYLPQGSENEQ